jgi:hypothetical protein
VARPVKSGAVDFIGGGRGFETLSAHARWTNAAGVASSDASSSTPRCARRLLTPVERRAPTG